MREGKIEGQIVREGQSGQHGLRSSEHTHTCRHTHSDTCAQTHARRHKRADTRTWHGPECHCLSSLWDSPAVAPPHLQPCLPFQARTSPAHITPPPPHFTVARCFSLGSQKKSRRETEEGSRKGGERRGMPCQTHSAGGVTKKAAERHRDGRLTPSPAQPQSRTRHRQRSVTRP